MNMMVHVSHGAMGHKLWSSYLPLYEQHRPGVLLRQLRPAGCSASEADYSGRLTQTAHANPEEQLIDDVPS